MRKQNWTAITDGKLPAGGYVGEITDVEDNPGKDYLNIVFDIAEGPHEGHFSDSWGVNNPWAHRFVRSYKPSAQGMFKSFLQRLQDSNPEFDIAVWERNCDERNFVGLKVGLVVQYEDYTNQYGEDKERLVVTNVYSVDYIRAGKFKVPERIDKRNRPMSSRMTPAFPRANGAAKGIVEFDAHDDDDLPFA